MDVSHIWLGQFDPEAPASYFEEQYGAEGAPLSRFAAEQGERWYDHDQVEISFLDEPQGVRSLVEGHSYADSYLGLVAAKAAELGLTEANVFVLADKGEFSSPRSASSPATVCVISGSSRSAPRAPNLDSARLVPDEGIVALSVAGLLLLQTGCGSHLHAGGGQGFDAGASFGPRRDYSPPR